MRLWDLPGARRFVESACAALRDGCSVVARFPGQIPTGFEVAVSASLGNILTVGKFRGTSDPFQDLCRRFVSGSRSHIRTLQDLCQEDGFQGRLIWLDGLNANNWSSWRDFLSRYAQASRSMPVLGRTLFFAPVVGTPPGAPPSEDVALITCGWDGLTDELDLMLLANECLRHRRFDPIQRSLLSSTVARVASWDFDSALRMLHEDDRCILAPIELLRAIGIEKGWTKETLATWEFGTASLSGVAHPALAALQDPPREIEMRVWSAQASVLLPWIEKMRHDIVAENLHEIRYQMRRSGMNDLDPFDLEVGQLGSIYGSRGVNRSVRKRVQKLRTARNALSHLRPLAPESVLRLIAVSGNHTSR